jgi:uncharacterized protein YbjT (DUF2867 family)
VGEPFVDAEDIADVITAVLTEDGHTGQVYEVTGPPLLTFEGRSARRPPAGMDYHRVIAEEFVAGVTRSPVGAGVQRRYTPAQAAAVTALAARSAAASSTGRSLVSSR